MKLTNALINKAGEELKKRFRAAEKEHCVIAINMKNDGRVLELTPIWCRHPSLESKIDFADAFCVYMVLKDGGKVGLPFMHALSFEDLVYNILTYSEYDFSYLENEEVYIYYKGQPPLLSDATTVIKKSSLNL